MSADHGPENSDILPAEPIANPGLPEHTWRPTDVDPKKERRAERQVATLFALSGVCTVGFFVAYFVFDAGVEGQTFLGLGASNLFLGLSLGCAMLFIGIGIIHWARKLMADEEISELRHPARSSDDDRAETVAILKQGLDESGIGRRPLVRNSLFGAVGLVGLSPIILLRDLGPLPSETVDPEAGGGLEHTIWDRGVRLARDVIGTPIKATDLNIGDLVNGQPENLFALEGVELQVAKSKASIVILRMDPDDIAEGPCRDWSVHGIVAYSKICTHVGCPISLNERTTHHLLCPCHQSTFDLSDSGKVVFGPAGHHLPQLPIEIDDDGYLVARSDFLEPVGPPFWERTGTSPEQLLKENPDV